LVAITYTSTEFVADTGAIIRGSPNTIENNELAKAQAKAPVTTLLGIQFAAGIERKIAISALETKFIYKYILVPEYVRDLAIFSREAVRVS
jgi:hypothetical protein